MKMKQLSGVCWNRVLVIWLILGAVASGQSASHSRENLDRVLKGFQSPSLERRERAFFDLIELGRSQDVATSDTTRDFRPGLLEVSMLFQHYPERADEIKLGLIRLLEREQRPSRRRHILGDGYHGGLIAAVADLRDVRALNALLGAIGTGRMATDGLAALGEIAVKPVIGIYNQKARIPTKHSAAIVLVTMLETKTISSPESREIIKQIFLSGVREESRFVRGMAVRGLGYYGDQETMQLVEGIAENDPFFLYGNSERLKYFPVREDAKKALQTMRSLQRGN